MQPAAMPALPAALTDYLAAAALRPFCWRTNNCAHFVAGWVRQATGRDALAGLRRASTPTGWRRQALRAGGMAALVTQQLRCEPVAPALAALGDVVLLPADPALHPRHSAGGALALCNGLYAMTLADRGAVGFVAMDQALHAWRLREVAP